MLWGPVCCPILSPPLLLSSERNVVVSSYSCGLVCLSFQVSWFLLDVCYRSVIQSIHLQDCYVFLWADPLIIMRNVEDKTHCFPLLSHFTSGHQICGVFSHWSIKGSGTTIDFIICHIVNKFEGLWSLEHLGNCCWLVKASFCRLWLGLNLGSFNNQEKVVRLNKTSVLDGFFPRKGFCQHIFEVVLWYFSFQSEFSIL